MTTGHYWRLVAYRIYADLRTERQRTFLGIAWWFIDPIIFVSVYYVVFDILMRYRTPEFIAFLSIGVLMYRWFGVCVQSSANSIAGAASLMRTLRLPITLFPTITVLTNTVRFLVPFSAFIVGAWIYGYHPGSSYAALPLVLLAMLSLGSAVGFALAVFMPFVPDLEKVIEFGLRALMFMSGIFYSVDRLAPEVQEMFFINPVAFLLDAARKIILHDQVPDLGRLVLIIVLSSVVVSVAALLMRRFRGTYVKVLP